jgi:hypothetical protein
MMELKGYDGELCPFIGETRYYELNDDTATGRAMRSLNQTFTNWLIKKNHEL